MTRRAREQAAAIERRERAREIQEIDRARRERKRAALYVRVSSTQEGRQHPGNQTAPLEQWCEENNYTIVETYIERDSGANPDRKQYERLFTDAAARKFDLVVCWSVDRFSREGIRDTLNDLERLNANGVGFYSYTEEVIRAAGPTRDFFISLLAWVAKFERERRTERVQAGLARARAKGTHLGRKATAFSPAQIAEMNRMNDAGVSLRAIAVKFGTSKSSVKRRLTN